MTGLLHETYGEQRTEAQKTLDEVVLDRVKKGIQFCEEHYGPDWVNKIDLTRFMISSGTQCVLGQLEGGEEAYNRDEGRSGFDIAYEKWFDDDYDQAIQYGFQAQIYPTGGAPAVRFDDLQSVWREEIVKLQLFT